jgi:hypothetical protein
MLVRPLLLPHPAVVHVTGQRVRAGIIGCIRADGSGRNVDRLTEGVVALQSSVAYARSISGDDHVSVEVRIGPCVGTGSIGEHHASRQCKDASYENILR